jgi:hypothetical protein
MARRVDTGAVHAGIVRPFFCKIALFERGPRAFTEK